MDDFVIELRAPLSPAAIIIPSRASGYQERIKRWSAAAEKPAAIVVLPAYTQDVTTIIRLLRLYGMKEFVVRGGGHATSGSSSTDGGVCIDLSEMRDISVNPQTKIVTAQGGCLWEEVDRAAELNGLAVVGGTVNTTGVGGLTLGGGYGYLVGKHGLVIDNLLEVEMVVSDGKVVTASRDTNKALFWAVRGAGASFGVVTSFKFQAHEQKKPVWGGTLVIKEHQLDRVVAFANKFLEISDPRSALIFGFKAISPNSFAIVASVFFNDDEISAKDLFAPLLELELLANETKFRPYFSMNSLFNADLEAGLRRSMKGSAFIARLELTFAQKCLQEFQNFVRKTPDAFRSIMVFEYFPFNKIIEVDQTDTAFANRGAHGNMLWVMGWTKEEHDEECRQWTRHMSREAHQEFERTWRKMESQYSVGQYYNYDGLGIGGAQVFGINFDRLVKLKLRYDPDNVFSKGPQLLPRRTDS